ncbi:MAG: hypothetical protein DHS20C18_13460 [Saprospiraceae bacterium]|nr:MAG: hypothetical protein DHS20C18_13460 [Saprospiraceae bacterium]
MKAQHDRTNEELLLDRIRDILLRDDRKTLSRVEATLQERQRLSEKVSPIIEEHIHFLKENFPREFQTEVEKIIDIKLKRSQEKIIELIFPKLGLLIRKYISHEIDMLRERIDRQVRKSWFGRLQRWMAGVKESDQILANLHQTSVEEVYIVQRDSGLLIGNASLNQTIDKELIAGMLTAIKLFMEDAFRRGEEEVELIHYNFYEIFIQNFYGFYIAVAIRGSLSLEERDQLSKQLFIFAEKELNVDLKNLSPSFYHQINNKLETSFLTKTTTQHNDQ